MNLLPQNGEAYFYANFFSEEESLKYFAHLKEKILWRNESIKMFGKWVLQPRLTAWYGDDGKSYRYSGIEMQPEPWTPELLAIKQKIEEFSEFQFNSVLLNLYRNGSDSMGWHSDDEVELGANPAIASVSFGEARTFKFKHRKEQNLKTALQLTNGSLLLMQESTQHFWHHSIPKTAKLVGERINLTFRKIVA